MLTDLREGIVEIFAEAQRLRIDDHVAAREWHWMEQRRARAEKRARYEARAFAHRRVYKTAWEARDDKRVIVARLRAGERPKRWGKRWRDAAIGLGIEVPLSWHERRALARRMKT